MKVTLSGKTGRMELLYAIRPERFAQIWARSLKSSIEKSSLREKDRFHGFPREGEEPIQKLLTSLDLVVKRLKEIHPDLEFPTLDHSDLQNSINSLHFNFAHAHHVTRLITPRNSAVWNEFNTLLHAIELGIRNEHTREKSGIPSASIVFTWNDSPREEIPDEAYEQFCLGFNFGVAYANYCETGRHFQELYYSKDDTLADEHIRPARLICGDTLIWLGPTFGDFIRQRTYHEMAQWFAERKERFNRLGFYWGDPRLALGYLPVARLIDAPHAPRETLDFIREVGRFNQIDSLTVS